MGKKFRALLLVNLRSMLLTSTRGGGGWRGKRALSGGGLLALIAFLALYVSVTYSSLMVSQLAPLGLEYLAVVIMGMLSVVMGTMYTVFAVQGVVFGGKDNDLMLSLPISPFQLMLARVMALVVENLVCTLFMVVPAGVCCYLAAGGDGLYFLRLGAAGIFLSLLPTVLALVGGWALTWLSARMGGRGVLAKNLAYLLLLAAVMVFAFFSSTALTQLASYAAGLEQAASTWGILFLWMARGVQGDWGLLAAFLAVCILPFLAVVWLFGRSYKRLLSASGPRARRTAFRLERQRAAGQTRALVGRELRRYFSIPIYFFNTGVGPIMMVIGAAAALVKREDLSILTWAMEKELGLPMALLLGAAVTFMLATCAVTATSISLEGQCLWILREAPVSEGRLFAAKCACQYVLTIPVTLVTVPLLCWAMGIQPAEGGLLTAACLLFALFHAPLGLVINLLFPRLDAPNETVVVKQSMAAMLGIFLPMAVIPLGALAWFLLGETLGAAGVLAVLCLVLLALTGGCWAALLRWGPRRLGQLV